MGKIRVLNTRDRYYNGAYKGNILEIEEDSKQEYLNAGFVLVSEGQEIENKKGIVEDNKTAKELKEILDHHGVEYKGVSKKEDLLELVKSIETKKTEDETEKTSDLEEIKTQIINEAIETEENLSKLSEDEILEIAKNNGLI